MPHSLFSDISQNCLGWKPQSLDNGQHCFKTELRTQTWSWKEQNNGRVFEGPFSTVCTVAFLNSFIKLANTRLCMKPSIATGKQAVFTTVIYTQCRCHRWAINASLLPWPFLASYPPTFLPCKNLNCPKQLSKGVFPLFLLLLLLQKLSWRLLGAGPFPCLAKSLLKEARQQSRRPFVLLGCNSSCWLTLA